MQFLATVSHEIRTPMNGILGILALLLATDLSSTQRAQGCGKALITRINEVLDRAKIEARKLELETVPFDLRSILDEVLSLFSEKSRNKGVELAVFVSDKVPEMVMGDPGRFRHILTNLVGNSVKFTERGHILVKVHLDENPKPIEDAKAESCLNGGSDEDMLLLMKLSESKMQPHIILVEKDSWLSGEDGVFSLQVLDWKQNGHVFKLPKMILLARNIMNVELEKAKAASFEVTIIMKPLRESMVGACLQQVLGTGKNRQPGRSLLSGSSVLVSLLCGKKILVVDDNMVNRRVAAGALKKFGATVECADSGKAALKLLQLPHCFNVCFMDIQMPEMDGFEATRLIRTMENQENDEMNGGIDKGSAMKGDWHLPILCCTLFGVPTGQGA